MRHLPHPASLARGRSTAPSALLLLALAGCASHQGWQRPTYPETRREAQVDTYHGVQVEDPYRWLEDPDSPESRAWIDAQNALTRSYLEPLASRAKTAERLKALWNYERFGLPVERGGRWFLSRNDGLQNQSVLYAMDSADGEGERVLLDPNTLSKDGTVALAGSALSDDGTLPRLRHERRRLGLDGVARARRRDGRRTSPMSCAGSSSRARRGCRTARASSTRATTRPRKAPSCRRSTATRSSSSTASAPRRPRTSSSTSATTSRTGASPAPSPTTAVGW
jgi:hypothetical protein